MVNQSISELMSVVLAEDIPCPNCRPTVRKLFPVANLQSPIPTRFSSGMQFRNKVSYFSMSALTRLQIYPINAKVLFPCVINKSVYQ